MRKLLFAWIGMSDLKGAGVVPDREPASGTGPIVSAVEARAFDEVVLLSNYPEAQGRSYYDWLSARTKATLVLDQHSLRSPTDYTAVYERAVVSIERALERQKKRPQLTFHLSPGTPAMATVWIILGKTRYEAVLVQSSAQEGLHDAVVPFELSAEFVPALMRPKDEVLERGTTTIGASFATITHRSAVMRTLIERAQIAAVRSLPVLLEGETGTGKEVLARAIHQGSPRAKGPFVPINCGAIPEGRIEAELFGWAKGSFTGALNDHPGIIEAAQHGTVFLDEVGELPPSVQVRLLRVLQEKKVLRVGETHERPIDARVIAATHRTLLDEVAAGRFREDLYFRLAVLPLKVPALRERQGDLGPLIDELLEAQNKEAAAVGEPHKKLSSLARNLLLRHPWPGNVRELQAVLQRASVWSRGGQIEAVDIEGALLTSPRKASPTVLDRPMGDGFSLEATLDEVAKHYLTRAMKEAGGVKSKAASLAGFANYQTLSNWLAKYEIKG